MWIQCRALQCAPNAPLSTPVQAPKLTWHRWALVLKYLQNVFGTCSKFTCKSTPATSCAGIVCMTTAPCRQAGNSAEKRKPEIKFFLQASHAVCWLACPGIWAAAMQNCILRKDLKCLLLHIIQSRRSTSNHKCLATGSKLLVLEESTLALQQAQHA